MKRPREGAKGRQTGGDIPQSELAVPRAGKRKLTIGRKDNILKKVRMTSQSTVRDTISLVILGEALEDEGFVTGGVAMAVA